MSTDLVANARAALEDAGITGRHVSHKRASTLEKIQKLLVGDPDTTFGLTGLDGYSAEDVLGFMADLTGCPRDIADGECDDRIDPDLTIAGLVAAGRRLKEAASQGLSLLVATGHPTGMLEHNMRVVDAYIDAGGKIVRPRESERFPLGRKGRPHEVRYNGGVGCLADWGQLLHTHEPDAMEALLEVEPWPDLVFADHGFAGAAIERGIPTIAVMDINDHALAVAAAQGRDVTIIPMDDNRRPRLYEPAWSLIQAVLNGTVT